MKSPSTPYSSINFILKLSSFNFSTKKLFFLPPPHKIIFSLYGSAALRAKIIIRAVNSVNVAAPSSKDKSFTNEKSKYFVSNDCISPVLKIFSFS